MEKSKKPAPKMCPTCGHEMVEKSEPVMDEFVAALQKFLRATLDAK